jgi:hypothetical protein
VNSLINMNHLNYTTPQLYNVVLKCRPFLLLQSIPNAAFL